MEEQALRRDARRKLRDDPERAPARSHFRAMGIDPDRLDGPIVGVASTWTGTMPCNLNLRALADRVVRQPGAGDAGDARLAGLARGHRRLDRADGPRTRLRRARLPGGLRQDD